MRSKWSKGEHGPLPATTLLLRASPTRHATQVHARLIVTLCFSMVSCYSPTQCPSSCHVTATCHISTPCHATLLPRALQKCHATLGFGFPSRSYLRVGSPHSVSLYTPHFSVIAMSLKLATRISSCSFSSDFTTQARALFAPGSCSSLLGAPGRRVSLLILRPRHSCPSATPHARAPLPRRPWTRSRRHTRVKADASGLIASIFEPIIGVLVQCITITSREVLFFPFGYAKSASPSRFCLGGLGAPWLLMASSSWRVRIIMLISGSVVCRPVSPFMIRLQPARSIKENQCIGR